MSAETEDALESLRHAMKGALWRAEAVLTFTHGVAVQVYVKDNGSKSKRYVKVGPLLLPPEGGSVADVLSMLGALTVTQ